MRHFEQIVLVSEDGKKTVIERRYSTGELEYWSVMSIAFRNQLHQGNAQVPFQVRVGEPGEAWANFLWVETQSFPNGLATLRDRAFDNFDGALEAAKPDAHQSAKEKVEQATRKEESKIVLAGAIPPGLSRINGGE